MVMEAQRGFRRGHGTVDQIWVMGNCGDNIRHQCFCALFISQNPTTLSAVRPY